MNKDTKYNFTKLTQKKGISLIILIVTIIVMIILAAVVVLGISKNNPIESARKAKFKQDITTIRDELSMYLSSKYAENLRNFKHETVNLSGDEMVKELPCTEEYKEKILISKGKIVYVEEKLTEDEIKWMEDLDIRVKGIDSKNVSKESKKYYGEYVLNYSTGNDELDASIDWKIFYADEKNIYLISADYVANKYLPKARKENQDGTITEYALNTNGEYKAYFTNILGAYTGSNNITDVSLQKLNSSYFNYLKENNISSSNNNMKCVAYMMDTRKEVWGSFAGEKAEYVIGGPTIEMLLKSYSQKNDLDCIAKVSGTTGYQVSKDGGTTWGSFVLTPNEELYVINTSDKKTNAIWISSPSYGAVNNLIYVTYDGRVNVAHLGNVNAGFRPLVCLKPETQLKEVEGGFEIY